MEAVTFEQLPSVVAEIKDQLTRIEAYILNLKTPDDAKDSFMTITEAATFLDLAVSTIYGKVCRMEIPVNKKGKRLYFEKNELLKWVKNGRKKTSEELFKDADGYLKNSRTKK